MRAPSTDDSPQRRQSPGRVRCVVLERGATPLTQLGSDEFDQTIVIAQMGGEAPLAFAQRATSRIASLERSKRPFESATLLTGDAHDPAAKAARRLIVLGLAAAARAHGKLIELHLTAPPKAGQQVRAELLGLVEEIWASSGGKPIPVRLRFGAQLDAPDAPRSGVFTLPARASS